jgi:2-polyprenyl-3-methyl-5-hydroxy-6-metoxy-1,4-benzoquinol methylase
MSEDQKSRRAAETAVKSCYSNWAESYFTDYYVDPDSYPPVHQKLVRDLIAEAGARTLVDAGCGPASMLRSLVGLGAELYGFDLTPEMVTEARKVMAEHGVMPERIWQGSVVDPFAFRPPAGGPAAFDAAICMGVLPHIPAALDDAVIANLRDSVRPGGFIAIEARNQLFALFTLNRYSYEFFLQSLIDPQMLGALAAVAPAALDEIKARFRMDIPPVRKGKAGEPGYDEVLSRTHNPLVLKERFAAAGLSEVRLLFYHFHAVPPMLESAAPALFREASLAMEADPTDWRGHFMASAFIVVGKRA